MALLVESRGLRRVAWEIARRLRFTEGDLVHDIWATGRWDEALASAGASSPPVRAVPLTCSSTSFARSAACCCSPAGRSKRRSGTSGVPASSKTRRGEQGRREPSSVSACVSMLLGSARRGPRLRAGVRRESRRNPGPVPVSSCVGTALFAEELGIAPLLRKFADASLPGRLRDGCARGARRRPPVARPTSSMPPDSSRVRRTRGGACGAERELRTGERGRRVRRSSRRRLRSTARLVRRSSSSAGRGRYSTPLRASRRRSARSDRSSRRCNRQSRRRRPRARRGGRRSAARPRLRPGARARPAGRDTPART